MIDATAILRASKLRRTPVRSGVIQQLAQSKRPLSVHDLATRLPHDTDVVTIYRTLNTLVDKKLVRRVRGDDRTWLFELVALTGEDEHLHAHFVCTACGAVECLPEVSAPKLPRGLRLGRGYEVTRQELTLHGTCPKCR